MGEVKDLVVGVHAVRTFKLHRGQMHSISAPTGLWSDGVCEAVCYNLGFQAKVSSNHPDLPAPQLKCSCGIYGSFFLSHLMGSYVKFAESVLTVIAAEGRTIVGTRGIRTERARVVAWWTPKLWATAVCTTQFVGAKRYRSMDSMLADYGIPVEHDKYEDSLLRDWEDGWWTR